MPTVAIPADDHRIVAGASAPPCVTSWVGHKRTLPLKAGPVSFKRLLGGASRAGMGLVTFKADSTDEGQVKIESHIAIPSSDRVHQSRIGMSWH